MIEKEPFRMYSSEEEIKDKKEKTWTLTIRVNAEEQQMIKELKQMLNINMDGTAIKTSMRVGLNVLRGSFGEPLLKYLTDPTRRRVTQE